MSQRPSSRRWLRDALVIAGVSLALLAVLEGGARLVEGPPAPKPRPDAYGDAPWVEAYRAEFEATRMRWEPLTYWRRQATSGEHVTVDSAGLRATPGFQAPAEVEVWTFGGSTMWGTGARDAHTIPAELGRALAARGVRARVVNLGESGYVSTQGRVALVQRLAAGERPDVVVFYDGANEVVAAVQAGRGGVPSNESRRADDFAFLRTPPVERRLARTLASRLLARSALWRAIRGIGRTPPGGRFDPLLATYDAPARRALLADVCRAYGANVEVARVLGQAYGFEVVAAWQPVLYSKRVRSAFELAAVDQAGALAEVYERYPTLCDGALAEEPAFANLSGLLDDVAEPLYIDTVHLAETGNRLVAQALADTLAARGVLGRLRP